MKASRVTAALLAAALLAGGAGPLSAGPPDRCQQTIDKWTRIIQTQTMVVNLFESLGLPQDFITRQIDRVIEMSIRGHEEVEEACG